MLSGGRRPLYQVNFSMISFFQMFLKRKISDSSDSGKTLPSFLMKMIEKDPELREYEKSLRRLDEELSADFEAYFEQHSESYTRWKSQPGSVVDEISGLSEQLRDGFRPRISGKSVRRRVFWTSVALMLFAVGITLNPGGVQNSDNPQIGREISPVNGPQYLHQSDWGVMVEPLKTTLISQAELVRSQLLPRGPDAIPGFFQVVRFNWENRNLQLNGNALDSLTSQSREFMEYCPVLDSNTVQVFDYVVQSAYSLQKRNSTDLDAE